MTASTPRGRFNWEEAVAQDRDLQRIDAFVKLTISKLPGQPIPRADAGRGSHYQPAPPPVKSEPPTGTMVTTSPEANGAGGSTPQFINAREYQSESSSEVDPREVNPMDELSDFESDASQFQNESQRPMNHVQEEEQEQTGDEAVDVEMEEEEEQTACEVCKSSDRENEIILCDDCNAEYHIFCLRPPLSKVPEESWYCPKCTAKHPPPAATGVSVKQEQARKAAPNVQESDAAETTVPATMEDTAVTATTGSSGLAPASGNAPTNGTGGNDPTLIPIAQALEGDPNKSNMLLIHACNCEDVKCKDVEFDIFCPHMKRFLRSVCWASHSDKWRSYRLARITAELFAYHAMNCSIPQCNVPLCVRIREEEIV